MRKVQTDDTGSEASWKTECYANEVEVFILLVLGSHGVEENGKIRSV